MVLLQMYDPDGEFTCLHAVGQSNLGHLSLLHRFEVNTKNGACKKSNSKLKAIFFIKK